MLIVKLRVLTRVHVSFRSTYLYIIVNQFQMFCNNIYYVLDYFSLTHHYGFSMYMEPLTKWWQHGPDSNFTIAIPPYFKSSFDEGPIFTTLYWKAVQGLKHVYVLKNISSEIINCLVFILSKPFLAFRGH